MPHRQRTWMVQTYSLGGANVHSHASLVHPSPHPKRHLDRFSRFFAQLTAESPLYFTMVSPSKFPLRTGDVDPI